MKSDAACNPHVEPSVEPEEIQRCTKRLDSLSFSQIVSDGSTSGTHSCGITTAGAAYCWGQEVFGEDGDGMNSSNSKTPTAVVGNHVFAHP